MLNILLVDDDLEFTRIVFNSINNMGKNKKYFIANICKDGEEAYKYIINNRVDIILLDLNMPKVNGIDLLLKLRDTEYDNIKKIIISGDGILPNQILNHEIQIYRFLSKPVSLKKICALLDNMYDEFDDNNLLGNIEKHLSLFYFNKSTSGYKYIKECIYLNCKYDKLVLPLERDLYVEVSRKFNIRDGKYVKWAIDKVIKNLCRYTDDNIIKRYFSDSRVTSKLFICVISEKVRIDMS